MENLMIKIENVSKQYILGQIGGTTLREELQRRHAKMLGKEDPTKKIGARNYQTGETFMALDGVSFDVKKGERVGIIGHNGAGKSTLLKLLSRVTAPTSGRIRLNGRVASMLEVGTGFHGELTGRENVYMNGAILGMTKKEIDNKIEDIIEFSEVRQFIDTPVKRYSSGMYVKLAFSVSAHLDSEIMIMDEVLAVGDMAFQKKCLEKMSDVSKAEGRTILYVSHNMNTIRQLCDRVIMLDHGKVVFDGDVEAGIEAYMNEHNGKEYERIIFFDEDNRSGYLIGKNAIKLISFEMLYRDNRVFQLNEHMFFKLRWESSCSFSKASLRVKISLLNGVSVANYCLDSFMSIDCGEQEKEFEIDLNGIMYGKYCLSFVFSNNLVESCFEALESIFDAVPFEIVNETSSMYWNTTAWGAVRLNGIRMIG